MSDPLPLPGLEEVLAARARLQGRVLKTPVFGGRSLNSQFGCELFFKCENLQRTGSFKYRGATNAVLQLDENSKRGVTTHSSGNHGAALALAAAEQSIPAHIVVPANATRAKREAIVRYGGRVIDCGPSLAEREAALARVREETGAEFVAPYNDARVIAGQGTAVLELLDEQPDIDDVWVPVGGGGLASGTVLAITGRRVRVLGAEPELADDAYWSLEKGAIQPPRPPLTIADGLRTALGSLTFAILHQYRLPIVCVSEQAIFDAQRLIWERLKLVVEPSAAVPLAGLIVALGQSPGDFRGRRIGILLSGGNLQLPALS